MTTNHLFSPILIRTLQLKNRIVVSPMQQYSSPQGSATDWHLVHLGSRAVGGAGLIITESTAVSPEGRSTRFDAAIHNDDQASSWKPVIDFAHEQGTKIAMQLGHFGSKGSRSHPNQGLKYLGEDEGGWKTKSSSAIAPFAGMSVPEALTIDEITEIKYQFVAAAKRAISVGFDAIEIHAAHGYLFHQFYSSLVNQRDDEYGGSFGNRTRFLLDTIKEIRKEIPASTPLLVRISSVDYIDDNNAWTIENAVLLATALKQAGVDMITASAGGFVFLDKSKVFPSYQVPFAARIKNETGILTAAVGAITSAKQADEIISSEHADLVVIAREHLRNPYFSIHASKELGAEHSLPFQYKRAF